MQQAQPISVTKKLGFAWGAPPSSLTHTLIGFQLNVFLLVIVKLQPRVVGAIVLSGRFWDGLMDPTVGMMTQRTRSRWGSLKPWLAGSIIPLALSYLAIWSVPPFYSESARAGFVAAAYLMYVDLLWLHSPNHRHALALHTHTHTHTHTSRSSSLFVYCTATLSVCNGVTNVYHPALRAGISCAFQCTTCRTHHSRCI
jgi:GPH family glycoside/pentoside/hexuronide:cation symporter